jgi:hypothetical protein
MYTPSTLQFPFGSSVYSSLRRMMPVLLAIILTLVVCGIGLAQSSGHSSRPTLIPNKKKYADRGMHPATGRSGTATLTVRATRAKDGQTTIEATTGVLGFPAEAPGQIKKIQLKPLNEDGQAIFAKNYTGLTGGGYFTTTVDWLQHLQQVQAQANIDGIDGRRTSVVTVVETVKNRPDLAVSNLTPATGITGAPVNISVIVKELNGDLGASANCVLYVDGVEVDRANGIYVDAGSTVSVAFTHVFQSPGTKQLEVKVENVSPSDWDLANNSVSGQIIITQPNDTLNYTASLFDEDLTSTNKEDHVEGWSDPTFGYEASHGFENSVTSKNQSVSFDGNAPHYSIFPYNVTVSETSGAASFSDSLTVPNNGDNYSFNFGAFTFTVASGSAYDATQNVSVYMYNQKVTDGITNLFETTGIQYQRFAGEVTYHSAAYDKVWFLINGVRVEDSYTTNSDSTSTSGTRLALDAQYSLSVVASSGDATPQVFSASPTMDVQSSSGSFTVDHDCNEFTFELFYGSDCTDSTFSFTRKSASAEFSGAP